MFSYGHESEINGEEQIFLKSDGLIVDDFNAYMPSACLRISKRIMDVAAALIFFLFFGWFYLIVWACVLLASGRPAIYAQPRLGKNGRVFKFYKFRSMVINSNEILERHLANDPFAKKQWMDYQKLENDPRITKIGKIIRKTSLDELPQFWNVLIGDMSLVGPRPCMLSQKSLYGNSWDYYCLVRPGITGLWQVSGRNKLSFNQRVELDVRYVKRLSLKNDILIFVRTIFTVMAGHGSR